MAQRKSKKKKTKKKTKNRRAKKPNDSFGQQLIFKAYLFISERASGFKEDLKQALEELGEALSQETDQTKKMLEIYMRQSQGQATKREVREANKQLRDVIKGLGLGVVLVLPFSPITLPIIVKLGQRLGVEVLPDSFMNLSVLNNDDPTNPGTKKRK